MAAPERLELITCPECGAPAEVIDRFVLPSTDGPVAHVKARCVTGPWFVVAVTGPTAEWAGPRTKMSPADHWRRQHRGSA